MTVDQQLKPTLSNSSSDQRSPREQELDLLVRMVEIPSPSHHEAELSAYLVESLKGRGFHAYQDDANNAIGILGSGEKTIILLGHMDTVPGEIPVRIDNGSLYGRGTVDAKGPLACFISAASRLRNEIDRSGKKIIVIAAVEEESATSRGAHEALRMFRSPDFCVIGEPSSWDAVTIGYKGRLLLDYELEIPLKHTAAQGKLVCEEAVDFWNRLKAWCEPINEGKGHFETIDPTIRSFNSDNNGICERARVKLGFRLPVDFPLEQFKSFLVEAGGTACLHFSGQEMAVRMGKSNALVKAFLQSIRAHQGSPRFKVKTGTSDMNVVAPQWKCPLLAYGPGDSSLDHTPNEHIEIEEYGMAIEVLELVLRTI
jgi:[amino group carrier protein]-lysine/ornithine hydrolase